jgi:hypothetical protein
MSLKSDHRRRIESKQHAFSAGASVIYQPQWQKERAFTILRCLPEEGQGFFYRIRSDSEGQEWIAKEADLRPETPGTGDIHRAG